MEEIVKKLRYKQGDALELNAPDGFRLGVEGEQHSDSPIQARSPGENEKMME